MESKISEANSHAKYSFRFVISEPWLFHQMHTNTKRPGKVSDRAYLLGSQSCYVFYSTFVGKENFENPRPQKSLRRKILKIRVPNKRWGGKRLKMVFASLKKMHLILKNNFQRDFISGRDFHTTSLRNTIHP